MKKFILISGLLAAPLVFSGSAQAEGPNPNEVWVESIQAGGTGCPAGTYTQSISDDRQAFTLIFDEFFVELAGRRPVQRKNCQIDLALHVPNGWQFSIASFDYRGYAYLEPGIDAVQTAYYYFQGQGNSPTFYTQIGDGSSEFDDIYTISDTIGIESVVWSPCGATRNLQINTDLRVQRRNRRSQAYGYLSTDSIDGEFQTRHSWRFGFYWRPC